MSRLPFRSLWRGSPKGPSSHHTISSFTPSSIPMSICPLIMSISFVLQRNVRRLILDTGSHFRTSGLLYSVISLLLFTVEVNFCSLIFFEHSPSLLQDCYFQVYHLKIINFYYSVFYRIQLLGIKILLTDISIWIFK